MSDAGPTEEEILARVGSVVGGKYKIRTIVGAGGMGAVYQAVNEMTEAPVAVKLLLQRNAAAAEAEKRFLLEARVAANLHHPNIVQIFDLGQDDDGSWFIVQELLEGEDLDALLERNGGTLHLRETLELLVPIMAALGVAHREGVVHRDLKPSNVFIDRRQENQEIPKLIDFGVSKVVETPAGRRITEQGGTVGTPDFMAPEQALGAEDSGPEVDVWAVGCLFFRCLTGRGPYPGPGLAVLAQMQQQDPDRLDDVGRLPSDIADVIAGALRREPDARYPSMAHFLGALFRSESVMSTTWGRKLIRAHRDDAFEPPPKTALGRFAGLRAKRAQIGLGVAAVVLSALAVGLALWTGGSDDERDADPIPAAGSITAKTCAPWRDALLDLREEDGSVRGVPQLRSTGWATAEAVVALGTAKRLCGGVSGEDFDAMRSALERFERRRGYGSRNTGADAAATAWAVLALHELSEYRPLARARSDLERTMNGDGSYGDGSLYATALSLIALETSDPEGTDEDRGATVSRLLESLERPADEDGSAHAVPGLAPMVYLALRRAEALADLDPERQRELGEVVARSVIGLCALQDGVCSRDAVEGGRAPVPESDDAASGEVRISWLPWSLAAIDRLLDESLPLAEQTRGELEAVRVAGKVALIADVERVTHSDAFTLSEHLFALGLTR